MNIKEGVTSDVSKDEGLGAGLIAVVIIIAILVICALFWISLNIVSKKCPTSKLGKKFNEWKAKRALSKEQKRLRDLELLKIEPVLNITDGSDVGSVDIHNNVVLQKLPNQRPHGNRIYPATDVDDGTNSV